MAGKKMSIEEARKLVLQGDAWDEARAAWRAYRAAAEEQDRLFPRGRAVDDAAEAVWRTALGVADERRRAWYAAAGTVAVAEGVVVEFKAWRVGVEHSEDLAVFILKFGEGEERTRYGEDVRVAEARRIVAAADDRAVLRQAAGPDANDDSAPVRRARKGGPKGGM